MISTTYTSTSLFYNSLNTRIWWYITKVKNNAFLVIFILLKNHYYIVLTANLELLCNKFANANFIFANEWL